LRKFIIVLMVFSLTNIFFQIWEAVKNPAIRIIVNEGGTSSSKTYSSLQILTDICNHRTKPLIVSTVSESLPHLKLGCIRDFQNIAGDDFDAKKWNATEHSYAFSRNVVMEFFSADQPGKASGPRRDILYCNEVNNIPKAVFDQLDMRTRRLVMVDFNPVCEFWIHALKGRPEVAWIHSTYLDARHVLPQSIIDKIEAKRELDPNWWNVYGLGLIGNVEGLVHPVFTQDDMPEGKGIEFYGLDFGYTNDPTCLVKCVLIEKDLFCDELIYETGLTNQDIAKRFETLGIKKHHAEIFADGSEPKSIEEIYRSGYNIKAAPKGPDSVIQGIQKINQYRQHWTKRSLSAIKEMRNYRYITDKDGKLTNKPRDDFNHAMDGRRYAVVGKIANDKPIQIF
jgi:phage terminase large subunit